MYSGALPLVCEMFLDGNYFSRVVFVVVFFWPHFYYLWSITKIPYWCVDLTYRDDRGRDDYYSPERSRSYSRSLSPGGGKDYRKSPRENGRSPSDKKAQTPSRSQSPRGNDHSPSRSRSRSYRYEYEEYIIDWIWRNCKFNLRKSLLIKIWSFIDEIILEMQSCSINEAPSSKVGFTFYSFLLLILESSSV